MNKLEKLCKKINIQRSLLHYTVEQVKNLCDPVIVIESQKLDKLIVAYTKASIRRELV